MLTLEQYNTFLEFIPDINAELKSKGLDVKDVKATAASAATAEPAAKTSSKERKKKNKKMNIEATSDEESD
jgi:hypothetical protein